jgi:hypothetical protein
MSADKSRLLVFLSSAARPRYREDALRAITLPVGTSLRFRYQSNLITEATKRDFQNGSLIGATILIAHLDRLPFGGGEFQIVPCRSGTLGSSEQKGGFFTFDFVLGDFAYAKDVDAVRSACAAQSPASKGQDGEPIGYFVFELSQGMPSSIKTSMDIEVWQETVTSLQKRNAFAAAEFFYFINGVFDGNQEKLTPVGGMFELQSGKHYQLRLTHFKEDTKTQFDESVNWLAVSSSLPHTVMTMPNNGLVIDSPYDEKSIHIQTASVSHDTNCALMLYRAKGPIRIYTAAQAITHIDINFVVKRPKDTKLRDGLMIGLLLTIANLATVFTSEKLWSNPWVGGLVALSIAASFGTGLAASYKLKKP